MTKGVIGSDLPKNLLLSISATVISVFNCSNASGIIWLLTGNLRFLSVAYYQILGVTISDRYASVVPIRGASMSPTFNPIATSLTGPMTGDYVLVEKFCLEKYKFSPGDVIVYRSPCNYKEKQVKRIIALPGDWVGTRQTYDVVKVPEGHCWVEGDNPECSMDSRSFGPPQ
ncbi:mitochondrial inner membrane protease subunit 2 [Cucumis melo var. makuwa]|uniref:Mitochondrial inner membrane protease subunit 2 n=1 Tax=Cucumis melo var. makuwa TaxID=1194695 RepID=A0A5D3DNS6_CUCMM|nr:mitochondrial inner membrane protease subunit 2 [Cucumis melo var. makuwa]